MTESLAGVYAPMSESLAGVYAHARWVIVVCLGDCAIWNLLSCFWGFKVHVESQA